MNKLLQYMIGAGNVSDKYLPHLVKYQNRGEVKKSPLLDMSTLRPVYDNIPSPEKMLESYKPLDEVKALSKAYQIAQREIDALTIADRKARINASLKARKQPFSAKQLADETQAIGDKLRLFPNDPNSFIDDYLNPAVFIGNLASNLGRLPLNIQEGDYIDAAMAVVEPLAIGAYEAIGSPLIKKMFNKAAPNVKFQAQRGLRRIVPGYVNKKMAAIDKGNQWTKDWYSNPIIKERYDNWVEKGYNYITPKEAAFQKQLIEIEPNLVGSLNLDKSYANRLSGTIARDNYDKLLEQGFFTKGTTNRSSAFDANTTLARYAHGPNDALVDVLHPEFRAGSKNIANTTVHENIHAITKGDHGLTRNARTALTKPFAKAEDNFDKYLRKPTEVHARIGELRRQFRLTPEQVVDVNTMNRIMDLGLKGKTSVDKRWFELVKDKQSLRWLFNNAPVVAAPVAGAAMLDQKNNGGLVVDPRGQWDHPGQRTIVPTPDGRITMMGVPYPVYGQDETGYGQMMYPGGEYQFPGRMVYEKPMMQPGGQYAGNLPKAQVGTMVTPLDFSKPLGTLQGASDVMSAPARTATYLLTGKYQDPSQALGINNPWGAFAADMLLDPMNLVGAGVARSVANKVAPMVSRTVMPVINKKIAPFVDQKIAPVLDNVSDMIYQINPFATIDTDIKRLNSKNAARLVDFKTDLSGGRGQFNYGVYPFKRNSNYLLKLDNVTGAGATFGTGDQIYSDLPDMMKNVNSQNFARIYRDIDLTGGNLPVNYPRYGFSRKAPVAGRVMNKMTGKNIADLTYEDLKNIPAEAYQQLMDDIRLLNQNKLVVDLVGDNILYDQGKNKFNLLDLSKNDFDSNAEWIFAHESGKLSTNRVKEMMKQKMMSAFYNNNYQAPNGYDSRWLNALQSRIINRINNIKKKGGQITMQGGGTRLSFEEWYKTVPKQKRDTSSYNLRRAYELAPQSQLDAFASNPNAHLYTAYQNPDNKVYEFMKSKDHKTLQKELDWYYSNDPEAVKFRKQYDLDKRGQYYKYVPKKQRGGPAPLYVSDTNDSRLKNYEDSLYNYNLGRRMAAVLDADKNLLKVKPGSRYDKALQAKVKGAGNKFRDNSETNAGGYKNYEKVASIMKEYQRKGNKAILPIRYQAYLPDPDNIAVDLVTLRSVWDALGVTDPRPPGAANLPEWKKPERQVIYKPGEPVVTSSPSPRKPGKKPVQPVVYKPNPPQLATVENNRTRGSMVEPTVPQLSPNLFTQNNMSKSRAVDFWNPSMPGGVQGGWHRRLFGSMEEADNFMKFIRENNLSQGYEVTNSGVNNDADRVSYAEGGENEEDPKTLMKKKLVGKVSTPMGKVNLRPIFPKFKTTMENLYDPNCPDGIGCSRQATRFAQKITGLPYQSYAPADATFRDAVAERQGLKNLFDQTGDLRRNADSHQPNWKYPTKTDFDKWKAGDIVTLDAGVDVFNYSPPAGYTWDDASQASHNGVVVGFTETGRPIIKHGYASGPNRGKSYTEVLGPDNRVKDLGHGRYAVKSVWRPKEIDDAGNINRVAYIAEPGEQRAARKQSTSANYSYFLNPTEEEKMVREQPVAAQTSGAANRLQTKQSLINMFNNEQLDKELQYKLGMTAEEVNRMKPVIFGVVGQESRFNDIDNPAASLKEVIGSVLGRGSRGAAQIKLSSLTKDERKVLGINRSKDLEKEDVAYKAAMLLLNNARKRMNQEVVEGTHPELVDKDEYFRSGYYYNAPARAINSAKSWGDRPAPVQILNPLTWANRFTSRRRPRPFSSENPDYDTQNELRMDKGSYPWKLMQQAKDLGVRVDFDKGQDLEEVVIRGARPGSTFERFSKGGQHGGLDRWFAEKWVDVKTGKDCGRQEGEKRGYPACRPSKRVSSETPKTSSEMSSAEKAKFKRTKTSSERIPYNHKRK